MELYRELEIELITIAIIISFFIMLIVANLRRISLYIMTSVTTKK